MTPNKYNNEYQKILNIVYKEIIEMYPSDCTDEYRQKVHIALAKVINILRPNPYKKY